jgi:DNA-binding response OmpR family regulator
MPDKILIVDDDATMVNLLATILEVEGLEALKALSAREAFGIMDTDMPDLIILDIMMPELDGFEVLARLRKDPVTKTLPVIILTVLSEGKDMLKGWRQEADEYVTKPFDPAELIETIRKVMARSLEERMRERARNIDTLLEILEKVEEENIQPQG